MWLSLIHILAEMGPLGLYGTGQSTVLGIQVLDMGVFSGITLGCLTGYVFNKYGDCLLYTSAARVALAKTESEIEKLLDTLSGANPLLLQYANTRIEELDAERQKQLRLVADLTANSVSASQIDSITGYLDDWESVSFDDKRKVVDILISQIDATSESVTIHWKI